MALLIIARTHARTHTRFLIFPHSLLRCTHSNKIQVEMIVLRSYQWVSSSDNTAVRERRFMCSILHCCVCAENVLCCSLASTSAGVTQNKVWWIDSQSTCLPLCVFLTPGSLISWFDCFCKDMAARTACVGLFEMILALWKSLWTFFDTIKTSCKVCHDTHKLKFSNIVSISGDVGL